MKLKNIQKIALIICLISWLSFQATFANDIQRKTVYERIWNSIETPDSYQYIQLLYSDIEANEQGFTGLQKLVYSWKLKNKSARVFPEKAMTKTELYKLLQATADKNLFLTDYLKSSEWFVEESDLQILQALYGEKETITVQSAPSTNLDSTKLQILEDVYNTLNENHYDSENFDSDTLLNSAIQWLASGTKDDYTSYFPPTENQGFQDWLQGEYEGIWAYVDMPEPGVVVIVSPIMGSPAEAAGLRWGDIIYSVDGTVVSDTESLSQVTSRIKWPSGTDVDLWILRDGKKKVYTVTRGKILLRDVIGEKANASTYYIAMKMFTGNIASQFTTELEKLNQEQGIEKIIIDLRNNPWGYLDQVIDILWHFIDQWDTVATVKYKNSEQEYYSYWYDLYDFSDKEIVILINEWTASASEIMAGTLKDYFPDRVTLVGTKSFGKGSVQTQRYYKDGSALKYTIAKWYTWKSQNGIDKVWLSPDLEVIYDTNLYETSQRDNQVEAAIQLR